MNIDEIALKVALNTIGEDGFDRENKTVGPFLECEIIAFAHALLAELAKQEPVAIVEAGKHPWDYCLSVVYLDNPLPVGTKLYAAPIPPAVPEGWKLVPIEPTQEMIKAAMEEYTKDEWRRCESCYADMLAAAPTPKEES